MPPRGVEGGGCLAPPLRSPFPPSPVGYRHSSRPRPDAHRPASQIGDTARGELSDNRHFASALAFALNRASPVPAGDDAHQASAAAAAAAAEESAAATAAATAAAAASASDASEARAALAACGELYRSRAEAFGDELAEAQATVAGLLSDPAIKALPAKVCAHSRLGSALCRRSCLWRCAP